MKKGFTLIELLGVVVLLGVIALITIPIVDTAVKKSKQKAYEVTKDTVVSAAKNWLTDNKSLIEDGSTLVLTISDLKEEGYLEFDIKNPSTGNCLDNTTSISIARTAKKYTYSIVDGELLDGTDDDCELISESPSIYLLGENPLNVEINTTFTDPGAKATDVDGNDISSEIITTGTVDTSVAANNIKYKYSILSNGVSKTVTRKINVIDKKAPVLTVPGNTTIDDSITSYDLMNGVSATDNSGATVNVTTKGKITFGETGTYTITYIATDSSGNTTTKSRKITVIANCFSFDATTGTITGYTWNDTSRCPMDLVIPAKIGSVDVKYISEDAFDGTDKINKIKSVDFTSATSLIKINDGFTVYKNGVWTTKGAFEGNVIDTISLSGNIETIGEYAFANNLLTTVTIPSGIVNINNMSFSDNNITTVNIPSSVRYLSGFFENDIVSLTIPNGPTVIGGAAFQYNKIINVVLPNSVTELQGSAFLANFTIETVTFGNALKSIGSYCFEYNKLSSLTFPSSLETIDYSAFTLNSIASISFNEGLKSIGYLAFDRNKITSVTLPSTLTHLGGGAFVGNKFTSQNFVYGINSDGSTDYTRINTYVGSATNFSEITWPVGLLVIEDEAFSILNITGTLNIPSGVTTIGNYAFWTNDVITANIPSSVTQIGNQSFAYGRNNTVFNISKPINSIANSPWGVDNATVNWLG